MNCCCPQGTHLVLVLLCSRAHLKTVTVAIAAPMELFCKNNKCNCSVGEERLSRKAGGVGETFSSLSLPLFHKTPELCLCALIRKVWHVLFYSKYHTHFPSLQEECQTAEPHRCSVARRQFHHQHRVQPGDYRSSRIWNSLNSIKELQLSSFQRGPVRRDNLPLSLGRRPSCASFKCNLGAVSLIVYNCTKSSLNGPITWN